MTSELRPAVEVAQEAGEEWERYGPHSAAAIIEADREAVRAEQAAEVAQWRDKYNALGQCALEQVSDLGTKLGRTEVELDAAKADLQAANRELAKWKALAETLVGALGRVAYSTEMSSYERHKVADKALTSYKEQRDVAD